MQEPIEPQSIETIPHSPWPGAGASDSLRNDALTAGPLLFPGLAKVAA